MNEKPAKRFQRKDRITNLQHDSEKTLDKCFQLLQKYNGKIEITFKAGSSDFIENYKVCLIFIRFPINQKFYDKIKKNVDLLSRNDLSKGRIHLEKTGKNVSIVGAIRVKYSFNIASVLFSFINKVLRYNFCKHSVEPENEIEVVHFRRKNEPTSSEGTGKR